MNINTRRAIIIILLIFFILAAFYLSKRVKDVNDVTFSEVQGRFWNLAEVKNGSTVISIERTDTRKDIYTIKFESNRLTGSGADNLYFASYTTGKNHILQIGRIASTRVAPSFEVKNFTEYEYFQHLERVSRWYLHDGKLELHIYDENGAAVVLVFV